jgi:hypothetical protein
MILWAISEGADNLKTLLRQRIKELLWQKWGIRDFSWVFYRCNTMSFPGSTAWTNICKSWLWVRKHLLLYNPQSLGDALALLVWAPTVLWKDAQQAGCKTKMKKTLREAGIESMEDLYHTSRRPLDWPEIRNRTLWWGPKCVQKAGGRSGFQ